MTMRSLESVLSIVVCLAASVAGAADKPGEELIKAAKKGDVARLRSLLQQGVPVNSQDGDGKTPLWEAARHDKAASVAALIEAKADLNVPSKDGDTPLLVAAGRDDAKVLMMLLAAGADTGVRNRRGVTVLMAAAGSGHTEVIGKLLQSGAKVSDEDDDGDSALHYAAGQSDGETVRTLIEAHAEVDHESHSGKTPLMVAAEGGHSEAVEALLRAGALPNRPNPGNKDWTALMYAASGGGTSTVIDSLASYGAEVKLEDTTRDQAIHIAARRGNAAIVGALIEKGAYVNERGGLDRRSPLEIAVDRDDRSTAEMLLRHHACVTRDAVLTATKKKSEKMIKLLEENGHKDCRRP
jgi:cytohesin